MQSSVPTVLPWHHPILGTRQNGGKVSVTNLQVQDWHGIQACMAKVPKQLLGQCEKNASFESLCLVGVTGCL